MGDVGVAPDGPPAGPHDRARWAADAFDRLRDFVAVIDAEGTVVYANPFAEELLALDASDGVGRNVAEFLHPDDLIRAIRVMAMMVDDAMDVPVTPAIYRVGRDDIGWRPIEINGSVIPGDEPGSDLVVIFGRYSGDRDLHDRIMELLVSGSPPTAAIELIPEFGHWRHPLDHYAVFYASDEGVELSAGSDVARALGDLHDPESPWAVAARTGAEVTARVASFGPSLRDAAAAAGLSECWAVPVPDPLHGSHAVIVAWGRAESSVMEVHRYALESMIGMLVLVLQWRRQVTELRRAARRDPLTGLTNRTGFWEVLESVRHDGPDPRVGVLYVDLDGFKAVNDLHGHRVGDLVLTEVGQRMAAGLRPGDVVARLGGDEFAILCPTLLDDGAAVTIAERVVSALERPFLVAGIEVSIGASVGIATAAPGRLDADALLDAADQALYRAKDAGRGRWYLESVSAP